MSEYHLLRVFSGAADGSGGNSLAVFLEGGRLPPEQRQGVAADLGLSETVFVDEASEGRLRIFTPAAELPFAGHPLVGAAWLLDREGPGTSTLRPPAGEVGARVEDDRAYVLGRPEWAPPFEHVRLASASAVDALSGPPDEHDLVGAWAWEDEDRGAVRARVFASRLGVPEDEATGSHALRLCARLGRSITVRQGKGSLIEAQPAGDGCVEIGGRVALEEVREYGLD